MNLKLLKIFIVMIFILNGCGKGKKPDSSIDKILYNVNKEQVKEFYFVGKEKEKIGIYKYNFEEKKFVKLWSDKKEKVILLSYSPNLKHVYFLTAKYYGIRSTLPYIKRVKLYSINLTNEDVAFVDTLMNGTQINADWISDNSFKMIVNSRDLKVSEYMNVHTFIYNSKGKKLLSEIKIVNFIKDGYPLPVASNEQVTENENYKLKNGIIDRDSLYLFDKKTNETDFIVLLNKKKLNKINWGNHYLIFTIKEKNKHKDIIIYSFKDKTVVKKIENKNIKSFLVFGNFLVYDYGLSFSSSISIFNLRKLEITNSIKINGGCGLRNSFLK